jgi:hypothetical protein
MSFVDEVCIPPFFGVLAIVRYRCAEACKDLMESETNVRVPGGELYRSMAERSKVPDPEVTRDKLWVETR